MRAPERLFYSGDEAADRLLATDPLALLVGFTLDQQVPLQKAFSGPLELRRRIGPYDAGRLAAMDPAELETAFLERPALHRFPAAMARRVQEVAAAIVRDYGGEPERIWTEAATGQELERRLRALPGVGEMKAATILAVLAKRFGVRPPGIEAVLPSHPTLGDVTSYEERDAYQAAKRARKAQLRAAAGATDARRPPSRSRRPSTAGAG